jgi:hypothetical protein
LAAAIESTVIVSPSIFPLMVTLSGQLIELALVAFQDVHLVSAGKGKVRPLPDAFAVHCAGGLALHHVMGSTHCIRHGAGDGLVGLGGGGNG